MFIDKDKYEEIQYLDELMRELQDETLNKDWGYWHFSLLNLEKKGNLETRILNALADIPKHKEPYYNLSGTKIYISSMDLKNLTFTRVENLKEEIIRKAEYWSMFEGPIKEGRAISEKFHALKGVLADKIVDFLKSKDILETKIVCGIDTSHSFGGDHSGDDILIDTKSGVYVIHFGFSS